MAEEIKTFNTDTAPTAIGPYSQAVRVGHLFFCSGQIPLDPETQQMVPGGIQEQATQVCKNVGAVLKAAGLDFSRVVKVNCYLKDMDQFSEFNEVYAEFFGATKPARAAIGVAKLPKDALVEIELVASF